MRSKWSRNKLLHANNISSMDRSFQGYPKATVTEPENSETAGNVPGRARPAWASAAFHLDPGLPQSKVGAVGGMRPPMGYLIPVVPGYTHTRPSTAPPTHSGTYTDTINQMPMGSRCPAPGLKSDSYYSLLKSVTSPFCTGMSLSSLGRPWQREQVLVTAAAPPADMVSVHLWPPHTQHFQSKGAAIKEALPPHRPHPYGVDIMQRSHPQGGDIMERSHPQGTAVNGRPNTQGAAVIVKEGPYPQGIAFNEGPYPQGAAVKEGPHTQGATVMEGPYPQGAAVKEGPHTQGAAVKEGPHTQGATVMEGPYPQGATVKERPHTQGATVKEGPYPQGAAVKERPHTQGAAVKEGPYPDGAAVKERPHTQGATVKEGLHTQGATVKEGPYPQGPAMKEGPYPKGAAVKERPHPQGAAVMEGQANSNVLSVMTSQVKQSESAGMGKRTKADIQWDFLRIKNGKEKKRAAGYSAGSRGTHPEKGKGKNRNNINKSAQIDSALQLRLFSVDKVDAREGQYFNTSSVGPTHQDDQDESSSEDDPFLDEGCEQFDEDLEPLDLSLRLPCMNNLQHGSLKTKAPKRKSIDSVIANISTKHRNKNSNPHLKGRKRAKTADARLNASAQSHSDERAMKFSDGKKAPLPLKKRQPTVSATKSLSWKNKVNTKNMLKSIHVCETCKCDFTCTSFSTCPLCNAPAVIENPKKVSNSNLLCLASLPTQLCLHRNGKRIVVLADSEILPGTVLGPLTGKHMTPTDISRATNPKHLWVTGMGDSGPTELLSTKDEQLSNWVRYVRLGHGKHNTTMVLREGQVRLVTTQAVQAGEEVLLKPENPLTGHLNSENSLACKVCGATYASPLFLATHNALFHYNASSKVVKPAVTSVTPSKDGHLPVEKNSNHPETSLGLLEPVNLVKKTSPPRWKCTQCSIFFSSKADQEAHISTVHKSQEKKKQPQSPTDFHCKDCPAAFRSAWGLRQHSRVHSEEPAGSHVFTCPHCGKAFWRKQSYRRHVLAHEASSEYQTSRTCLNCGRRFYSSSNLKVHMLTHSGIKPFICKVNDCATGFTTKQSLQFHYIKRHGFTYDTMPLIERCVPFTFEQYCGSYPDMVKEEMGEEDADGAVVELMSLAETRNDEGYRFSPAHTPITAPDSDPMEIGNHRDRGGHLDIEPVITEDHMSIKQSQQSDCETRSVQEDGREGFVIGSQEVNTNGEQVHVANVQTPAGSKMLEEVCTTKRCLWKN